MGKQRTPQGRPTGRGAPPRNALGGTAKPPEAVQAAAPEAALHPAEDSLPAGLPEPAAEPLHAHLLDTVSPEALGTATPSPEPASAAFEAASPEMPVPADANVAEAAPVAPEPAPLAAAPEAVAAEPTPDPVPEPEAAPVVDSAPAPEAVAAYTNVVPLKSAAPERPPEPVERAEAGEAPVQLSDGALPAPASWRAGRRPVPPLRQDLEGMGETLFAFVRSESSAVLTHLNALKDARSPADAIRLQVNEIQRAADASLTCWSEIARRATRIVAQR